MAAVTLIEARELSFDQLDANIPSLEVLLQEMHAGVRPLDLRVRLHNEISTYPKPQFLRLLYGMVDYVDTQINDNFADLDSSFMRSRISPEDVAREQKTYLENMLNIVGKNNDHNNVVFAFPLHGAVPILTALKKGEVRDDLLFPAPISGTVGAKTGEAQVVGEIPSELLDEKKIVIFADDVLDSGVSAITLALERRKKRLGDSWDDELYSLLPSQIKKLRDEGNKYTDGVLEILYKRAAKLIKDENIVVAPFYCKNDTFRESLQDLAGNEDTVNPWNLMQLDMLDGTVIIDEDEWIMGGQGEWVDPMLDTGVNGIGLFDFIPKKYHDRIKEWGLDRLYLRVGAGIKGLVVFNSHAYPDLVESMASLITAYMDKVEAGEIVVT